ncbi:hypothetical protein M8J77_009050 [Diaphorina citri]|nr:hypothetical protein M8J77_009050 [Diaphorina citri]
MLNYEVQSAAFGIREAVPTEFSFKCTLADGDCDMRFVFCACSICYILDDWSGMDRARCLEFIFRSLSYDGAFGQGPCLESHGGSTYCALASLALMNKLDMLRPTQIESLKRWLIFRQRSGFQGRPNKPVDTCYTFWIGASLSILNSATWIDEERLLLSVLDTQHMTGGLSKWSDTQADILHTYLGIAGLSLLKSHTYELAEVYPALNVTKRAFAHLQQLHQSWAQ